MVSGVNFIDLNYKNKVKQNKIDKLHPRQRAKVISDHVNYIARVEGAANNGEHSLFGTLANNDRVYEMKKNDILKYIRNKINDNAYAYRTIISIKQDEAEKYGFTTKEDFDNLIRTNISNISKEYNISYENLDWVASLHTEEGHIHAHLVFWDNINERVVRPYVRYDNIKKELNKSVYREELEILYKNRNEEKNLIKDIFDSEIESLVINNKNKLFKNKVEKKNIDDISVLLKKIYEIKIKEFEETGKVSFKLKFQSKEDKKLIRETSLKIVESSIEIKENIRKYVEASLEAEKIKYANMGEKTIEKISKKIINEANEFMFKKIDNQILNYIKEARRLIIMEQKLERYDLKINESRNKVLKNNLNELLILINTLTADEANISKNINKRIINKAKTKAERREWYLKNRDIGMIEWEE